MKGYNLLTEQQKELFQETYKKHLATMGKETQEKHDISKINYVKWNTRGRFIEVHFEHAWYKYYPDRTWG